MPIVRRENLAVFLQYKMSELGMNISEFAEWLGMSRQGFYMVANGSRPASKQMQEKLNMKVIYEVDDKIPGVSELAGNRTLQESLDAALIEIQSLERSLSSMKNTIESHQKAETGSGESSTAKKSTKNQ